MVDIIHIEIHKHIPGVSQLAYYILDKNDSNIMKVQCRPKVAFHDEIVTLDRWGPGAITGEIRPFSPISESNDFLG